MKIAFTVFFVFVSAVASLDFQPSDDPRVEFGDDTGAARIIIVDENNDGGRVTFVRITGVQGSAPPTVNPALGQDLLQIETIKDSDSEYHLDVNLLDYEVLRIKGPATNFPIDVYENVNDRQTISLSIRNLDDEPPTLSTTGCTMMEEEFIDVYNSNCIFVVSDADGFLGKMDYSSIQGTSGESELFDFEYRDAPADNIYEANVYLILKTGKKLDYETKILYTFHVEAKDSGNNPTDPLASIPIIVQVEDAPDQPPQWDTFQSAFTIQEEEEFTIHVSAKDGDYGINNPIEYDIEDESGFITIDKSTGEITIAPIDRDVDSNDQVKFTVIAYEVPEPTSNTSSTITLIVEDIDDNVAVLSVRDENGNSEKYIDILVEENISDLGVDIYASDIDLGENAIYNATLEPTNPEFLDGFSVIPVRGYEKTGLTLAIRNSSKLDYEDPNWRVITMTLITTGNKSPENIDSLPITITLIDINDETPSFFSEEYNATIPEDIGVDKSVANIKATDRDQEDIDKGLRHDILGTLANSIMKIEDLGGLITTTKEDAFDYEKQNELIVQIRATDAVGHWSTAQLTITVTDVNDEDPRLVVSSTIEIEENQKNGFVIDSTITASDEDTTPDLEFSIDWGKSYAVKNSQKIPETINIQCIDVATIFPNETNKNVAKAELTIIEITPDNTPDYELFDSLYLQLVVTDKNTTKGDGFDSALIVISIRDINDNAPLFVEGTEAVRRQVTENSANGTVVTSVVATDADIGDNITYTIEPADDDTPLWVVIDSRSGSVTVSLSDNDQIDCDDPKRDDVKYRVSASDGVHTTSTIITINIIDQNDVIPVMDNKEWVIPERPNSNGELIDPEYKDLVLDPTDGDRDAPNNVVSCSILSTSSDQIKGTFAIDENNVMKVQLQPGFNLDREQTPSFQVDLDCMDDPKHQGPTSNHIIPRVSITLTDINDNYPYITNTDISGVVNEDSTGQVGVPLRADDLDAGDNGLVDFNGISKIERFIDDIKQDDPPQDLIVVANGDQEKTGILTINDDLQNNYGTLVLTISLADRGTPPLSQEIDVYLEVLKYNFEQPKFIYPNGSETIYLQKVQDANSDLRLFNGDPLPNVQATDQQDGKFGVNFTIADDSSGAGLFNIVTLGNSQGRLQLTTTDFTPQLYTVTITATNRVDNNIQGGAAFTQNLTAKIDFFDIDTDPIFSTHSGSVDFKENQTGLTYTAERATYAKDDLPGDLPIRYLINSGDPDLFTIDAESGVMSVLQILDYETTQSYTVILQSSNSDRLKPNVLDDTKFNLTVNVIDINDNPPVFESHNYVTTVTVQSVTTNSILEVKATDLDTTSSQLRFAIDTWVGSEDVLNQLNAPFKIESSQHTGTIIPNFSPKETFKGFFTLQLTVNDEDDGEDHMDRAEVKIYLVTNDNIVRFTFGNDQETVQNATDGIKAVLDANFASYNYVTHVENPTQGTSENDSPRTIAQVYFLDTNSNAPIQATEIYKKVTDVKFFDQLRQAFVGVNLLLLSFDSESQTTQNLEATLKAWLIGVSVVLGALCLILLIAFVLKTRALNQRINKLSNTKFGSQESGLNRTGVAAPTTNKHAVEGSNPVYNTEVDTKEIDRKMSVTSGDSDLIGVEDDDKFDYNANKDEFN